MAAALGDLASATGRERKQRMAGDTAMKSLGHLMKQAAELRQIAFIVTHRNLAKAFTAPGPHHKQAHAREFPHERIQLAERRRVAGSAQSILNLFGIHITYIITPTKSYATHFVG